MVQRHLIAALFSLNLSLTANQWAEPATACQCLQLTASSYIGRFPTKPYCAAPPQALLNAFNRAINGGPAFVAGSVHAPNISIQLSSKSGTQTAKSAADGSFVFHDLQPGHFEIAASYRNRPISFRLDALGPSLNEFDIPPNGCAQLDGPLTNTLGLAGRLLTSSGTPIANANIIATFPGRAVRYSAQTNADGSFRLPNLPTGSYQLVAASTSDQMNPRFRSSYYNNKAILEVPKNGHGQQDIEFRATAAPKLIPIRAFLTRRHYHDHRPGQRISFLLLNANSHVDLLKPAIEFTCTIDSALSCFIPLVEGELYRPPGVLLPEWTVRASPGGYIHLW